MEDWQRNSTPTGFGDRLVAQYSFEVSSQAETVNPSEPKRASSSSMIVTARSTTQHGSTICSRPPSLVSSVPTCTDTSIGTSCASAALSTSRFSYAGEDAVVVRPPVNFPCAFDFLRCLATFEDRDLWITHCLSHFHGMSPPRKVQCPHCRWGGTYRDGHQAWTERMEHVATDHLLGQTQISQASRPDNSLFLRLHNIGVIDDAQLQELRLHHTLSDSGTAFTVTQGPASRQGRNVAPRYVPRR
ncbi:hypothetical protein BJ546DRAFT_952274 [Cryomyces antarcticus]